jgi:hypothetical protein
VELIFASAHGASLFSTELTRTCAKLPTPRTDKSLGGGGQRRTSSGGRLDHQAACRVSRRSGAGGLIPGVALWPSRRSDVGDGGLMGLEPSVSRCSLHEASAEVSVSYSVSQRRLLVNSPMLVQARSLPHRAPSLTALPLSQRDLSRAPSNACTAHTAYDSHGMHGTLERSSRPPPSTARAIHININMCMRRGGGGSR